MSSLFVRQTGTNEQSYLQIYWLYLFTGFIYSIWWLYLLDLSIGLFYSLPLFIRFGGFIYWIYLLALVLAYTVSILIAISVRFLTAQKRTPLHFSHYTYLTCSCKKSSAFPYVITRA